jgi:hypothetical protein
VAEKCEGCDLTHFVLFHCLGDNVFGGRFVHHGYIYAYSGKKKIEEGKKHLERRDGRG